MLKHVFFALLILLHGCGETNDNPTPSGSTDVETDTSTAPDTRRRTPDIDDSDIATPPEDVSGSDIAPPPPASPWKTVPLASTADLQSIWSAGGGAFWAVGLGGALLHYNGATWLPSPQNN